mmetsp:Transcript_6123/g.15984  ORF Transcript_6123/g.15984 Transcript_6123/m.15984 type:complete len:158 (-) Transcript_6123:1437-1910(-)
MASGVSAERPDLCHQRLGHVLGVCIREWQELGAEGDERGTQRWQASCADLVRIYPTQASEEVLLLLALCCAHHVGAQQVSVPGKVASFTRLGEMVWRASSSRELARELFPDPLFVHLKWLLGCSTSCGTYWAGSLPMSSSWTRRRIARKGSRWRRKG